MPPANKRWTDIHDAELTTLHAENLGVRAIAERMGFGRTTISTNAKGLGLTLDRRQTRAATAAIQADAKAKRAALELKLLEDAERLRSQLWQPHTYIDHGARTARHCHQRGTEWRCLLRERRNQPRNCI